MSSQKYTVEVQQDFIERQSSAEPIKAVSELIWNSLDADASVVDVRLDYNELGMSGIVVSDNGEGMSRDEAVQLFTRLGGSWKKPGGKTKKLGRMLHGQEGRGRFKAFALGRVVDWEVVYKKEDGLYRYTIAMVKDSSKVLQITDEQKLSSGSTGVTVTITELHKHFRSLESDEAKQDFSEIFALYLKDYSTVKVTVNGNDLGLTPI